MQQRVEGQELSEIGLADHDDVTAPMRLLPELLELLVAARMTALTLFDPLLRRRELDRVLCRSEVVANLRTLELYDYAQYSEREKAPKLAKLWAHLSKLETLIVYGRAPPLRDLSVASLRHLWLRRKDTRESICLHLPDGTTAIATLTVEFTDPHWPVGSVDNLFRSMRSQHLNADTLALVARARSVALSR